MEATEGLAEASDITTQSVQAFAQLASSDRVSGCLGSEQLQDEFYTYTYTYMIYRPYLDIHSCGLLL